MAEVIYQMRSFCSQFRDDVSQSLESRHRGIVPDSFSKSSRRMANEGKTDGNEGLSTFKTPQARATWPKYSKESFHSPSVPFPPISCRAKVVANSFSGEEPVRTIRPMAQPSLGRFVL
jgi:hypothetical protein